jgi:hypothetical protein
MPKRNTNTHMDTNITLDDNTHHQTDINDSMTSMKDHQSQMKDQEIDKGEDKRRQARTFDERDIVCSLLF